MKSGTVFKSIFLMMLIVGHFSQAQVKEKDEIINGNRMYESQVYQKAEVAYKKALIKNSQSTKANYNLGNTLYHEKRWGEAIKHYETALKSSVFPKDKSSIYFNLGNAYMEDHNTEKALEAYKNALKNNPNDEDARINYILAKKKKEEQEEKEQNKNPEKKSDKGGDKQDEAQKKKEEKETSNQKEPSKDKPEGQTENKGIGGV